MYRSLTWKSDISEFPSNHLNRAHPLYLFLIIASDEELSEMQRTMELLNSLNMTEDM